MKNEIKSLLVGIAAGLIGIGGGIIMVPCIISFYLFLLVVCYNVMDNL